MRGQLSLSMVEAAVGVLLIFAVAGTFGLATPDPGVESAQLDAYATDATTVLAEESSASEEPTRLVGLTRSPASFERERDSVVARLDGLLPTTVLYRVETPHGSVGYRPPTGVPVGRSVATTRYGAVTIRVWYV